MSAGETMPRRDARQRFAALSDASDGAPRADIDGLRCVDGGRADYRALARFHYLGGEPATMTRVLTLRRRTRTVVGRYLGRDADDVLAAVLVLSLPHPSCTLRDIATNGRYRNLPPRQRLQLINREVRTISRVVVDPQFRGLGLAVRLVRRALSETRVPYVEALAAMGRVHPFFERAGMQRYDRPPLPGHQRLLDCLAALLIEPWELASPTHVQRRLEQLDATDDAARRLLERELRRFARGAAHLPPQALRAADVPDLLALARERLLCQPVYYLFRTSEAASKEAPGHDERC
jgi:GNAT superfamily N-acetyltransferase